MVAEGLSLSLKLGGEGRRGAGGWRAALPLMHHTQVHPLPYTFHIYIYIYIYTYIEGRMGAGGWRAALPLMHHTQVYCPEP